MKTTITVSIFSTNQVNEAQLAELNNTTNTVLKTTFNNKVSPVSLVLEYGANDISAVHQLIHSTFADNSTVALNIIDKCLTQEIMAVKKSVDQQMKAIAYSIEKCRSLENLIKDYKRLVNLAGKDSDYYSELQKLEKARMQEMINVKTVEEDKLISLNSTLAHLKSEAMVTEQQLPHTQHTEVRAA